MLVLSRHEGERIYIGEDITIIVGEIERGRVRLCIEAPPHVKVNRQEVWERINGPHNGIRPQPEDTLPLGAPVCPEGEVRPDGTPGAGDGVPPGIPPTKGG